MSEVPASPLNGLSFWVAHTPTKTNPKFHHLTEHSLEVARLASEFAAAFEMKDIGYFLGVLHDLGKFKREFQQYLLDCHRASQPNSHYPRPKKGSVAHKQAGAFACERLFPEGGKILSLPLYGHHGGMESKSETPKKIREKTNEQEVQGLLDTAKAVDARLIPSAPSVEVLRAFGIKPTEMEMALRLLYSCLVDADALDTEAHSTPEARTTRQENPSASLDALLRQFLEAHHKTVSNVDHTMVNQVRAEVYRFCLEAAQLPPGFFTLTVPTGGGKTRSSLGFALQHAVAHQKRRVIYAIPYTSIIDQTATVFEKIFGEDAAVVLEHHSAIDIPEGEEGSKSEQWRRLAAQNWDAPIILTTMVQLFESLFSNRPAACRKLHRIAHSVIVLDEVQTLPPHLLIPIHSALKALVDHFGVTIVFCTATQPAHESDSVHLKGLDTSPIIPPETTRSHFLRLKRVTYHVEQEKWGWERTASQMRECEKSVLCIVNTRRQALRLLDILDSDGQNPDVFHLSTLLCGRHRKTVLQEITRRLRAGERTLLVSTTVVEAGVDLDFDMAMRALGPLERIIQAAGRCNREGLRSVAESKVVIFEPEDDASARGVYRMALERTRNLLKCERNPDFDSPDFVTNYFRQLRRDLGLDPKSMGREIEERRKQLDYKAVAQEMRLINEDTVSVLVMTYDTKTAEQIVGKAKKIGRMTKELWRKAQPLSVSIYERDLQALGTVVQTCEGVEGLLLWQGDYHPKRGIPLSSSPEDFKPADSVA